MSRNLADRLTAARHARFVGRDGELAVFGTALKAEILPFFILHIFGPGGVGKTTLLQEFALLSEQQGAHAVYLDARHMDLSPDAFVKAWYWVMSLPVIGAGDPAPMSRPSIFTTGISSAAVPVRKHSSALNRS